MSFPWYQDWSNFGADVFGGADRGYGPPPPGFPMGLWILLPSQAPDPEIPGGERQPDVPPLEDYWDNLPPYTNPPLDQVPRDPRQEQPPEARWEDEGPPGTPRDWSRLGWPPPNLGGGFPPTLPFVARGPQPRRGRDDLPVPPLEWPWPTLPRTPRRPQRREPSLGWPPRFEPRIPEPLPEERAPYPFPPPPRTPIELPAPPRSPDLEQLPRVEIPPPVPTERPPTLPQETRSPPAPGVGIPPQPLPQRVPPRPARPRVARWPRIAQLAAAPASILRRYISREDEAESVPRFDFRDSIPETAIPLQPQPAITAPPQVAPPAQLPAIPDLMPDLTPLNQTALPFAQPFTQPARRTDECRCEDETEEEAEERREANASNVVAEVKSYRRRMSQNSLDNLE